MPTIRVDEEVWQELQTQAEPFVDSPNDVLRRLLGLASRRKKAESPPARGNQNAHRALRTQESEFRLPILEALTQLGGRGRADEALGIVERTMKSSLKAIDYEPLNSGEIRWRNAAKWERKHMLMESPPLLNPSSPRGWWEITEAGKTYLQTKKR